MYQRSFHISEINQYITNIIIKPDNNIYLIYLYYIFECEKKMYEILFTIIIDWKNID
jgi:hypothetical protein